VTSSLLSSRPWIRYAVAIAASLLAYLAARLTHDNGQGLSAPFIPALAAVIISAAWAGPGPGLAATAACASWLAPELASIGRTWNVAMLDALFFSGEGVLVCLGAARILGFARRAASSEASHHKLLETASEGIWIQADSSTITYANARMAEMLGVPVDRLIGRSVEEFYFPSDVGMEKIRIDSLSSGKQQFDRRLRRSDGAEIWVLACCNAIDGESHLPPQPLSLSLSMMTDITERKRAEQALRRSEQNYRDLFNAVIDGLYQTTPDGQITAANPPLVRMLGFTREADLRGRNFAELAVAPSARRKLLEQLERDGGFRNVESELRTANGEIIYVLENGRVRRDENGAVSGYECTVTDITAKKRVEEQLREAQKVEALGRLASGVARDFGSVLSQITGHLDAARAVLSSSDAAWQPAAQAREAAVAGEALIRQLLLFSRTEVAAAKAQDLAARETILLLEDDPLVRELSRDMLERQGYRVVLATEASDAERIGSQSHFDLLIADVGMTEMTGRLRAVHPGLRILFVAGYDDATREEAQLHIPNTGFISKPFSADSLSRRIREILTPDS
jgi:PAS domain S-box-containing protein